MAHAASRYPTDRETETSAEREARLAWERERLAEAYDDIAHGRVISGDEAIRWLKGELAEAEAAAARETE